MSSFRRAVPALAGLVFASIMIAGTAAPAWAAPPYPVGSSATALVGGAPLVQSLCPTATAANSNGTSTNGGVSVGSPAGAACTGNSASTQGQYAISGVTAPLPSMLRFAAQCVNSTGDTGGSVDVPAGSVVNGVTVTTQTNVTALNATVVYPGGQTATLNQVVTTGTSVTRRAIVFTGGANTGTVVGRVTCGTAPYPLAVDVPAAGTASPALAGASTPASSSSSHSALLLLAGAALAVLVLAQVGIGRNMWRRRRGITGS